MNDTIVQRLKDIMVPLNTLGYQSMSTVILEGSNRIEALEAEVAKLKREGK